MKTIFGVSSTTPSNKMMQNGYTMYDWLKIQKCIPKFWGRNISGQDAINLSEINYLKEKNCKVFFVFDELTEEDVSTFDGTNSAAVILNAMRKLEVPKNKDIAIFIKLNDSWSINYHWMISFTQAICENGYVPGFIGNTDSSTNFIFDRHCTYLFRAAEEINCFEVVFMVSNPKLDTMTDELMPHCSSALKPENVHIWSCGTTTTSNYVGVEDIYVKDEKIFLNMW